MPSIFIWKTDIANTSKQFIRYYAGSNWFLEDNDYSSNSYMYLQQIVIPGSENNSVITFHVKKMPIDWVGADLLEVNQVPYRLLKSDNYATLEHIGNWIRCIVHHPIEYTLQNITNEYKHLMNWKNQEATSIEKRVQSTHTTNTPHKLYPRHSIQHANYVKNRPTNHRSDGHRAVSISSSESCLTPVLDSRLVQQQFQEFLQKFNVQTVLNNGFEQNMRSIPLVSRNQSMMFKYS